MITPQTLFEGTFLAAATGTPLFTSKDRQRTRVEKFTLLNTSTSAETVHLYIVAKDQSVADRYRVTKAITLAPSESRDVTEMRHILEEGDFIEGYCSTANVVTARASGSVIT